MAVTTIPTAGIADDAVTAPKILDDNRLVVPLIINGDMQIAQRGTSSTGKTSSGYYASDRWHINLTTLGTWTIAQESLTSGNAYNNGFVKSFRMDCTTADASPAASDSLYVRQKFEGQNLRSLKKGTSSAEKLTATFWVKSNKTGTYTCAFYDHDNTRFVAQNYTISSADTWEKKIINFPADTSGAMDNDNAVSLDLRWYLGAGSNFTGGTQQTTWGAYSNANALPSGHVNLADSTDNDWAITGVQLEIGEFDSTTIPTFPYESTESNLRRCRRYYEMIVNKDVNAIIATGGCYQADVVSINYQWYPKRSTPSIDQGSGSNYFGFNRGGGAITFNSIKIYSGRANTGLLYSDDGVSASTYENGWIYAANANAYVALDSEL